MTTVRVHSSRIVSSVVLEPNKFSYIHRSRKAIHFRDDYRNLHFKRYFRAFSKGIFVITLICFCFFFFFSRLFKIFFVFPHVFRISLAPKGYSLRSEFKIM